MFFAENKPDDINGYIFTALTKLANTLEAAGIETETIYVGSKDIRGCMLHTF